MSKLARAVIFALWCLVPQAAVAESQSEMLFQHKHWEVELVAFDDGTFACLAEVDAQTDSFTLWLYADYTVKLQFFSTSWEFGEGDTADLQVQIGSLEPWHLTDANLYMNSILFTLPEGDDAIRFLTEVAQGNRLYLGTATGEPVMEYSLAGSNASMRALGECGDALAETDRNPFD